MIPRIVGLLAALLPLTFAAVQITGPTGGDSITGLSIDITWKDDGQTPALADLVSYQMFLCAGGNEDTNYIQLATLVQNGVFTSGSSVTKTITAGLGANVANAYFIKVISAATGGSIINFSDRFTLASMTGTFPITVTNGLKTVTGTAGPATVNQITSPQNGAAGVGTSVAAGAAQYNVPYTLQTADIRYAPMPPMAQSSITAKDVSAQWPTSAYTVYKANVGTPNAITTNTMSLTFSISSRENTVAAAGQPTDAAMQKFLNRWKD